MQIEEPFGILPMEAFCDGAIYPALLEAVLSEDKMRKLEASMRPPAPWTDASEAASMTAPAVVPEGATSTVSQVASGAQLLNADSLPTQ